MRRFTAVAPTVLALLLVAVSGAGSLHAATAGGVTMEIRVDGERLAEYPARDRTYVEAREEHEYAIRLTNHTGRRVAVALSVDGLNTIDAKHTGAREASKWILSPHGSITIEGWQTGLSTARRFFFTTEDRSYGAWLGRTRDLGLISAAVFRERSEPEAPIAVPLRERSKSAPSAGGDARAEGDLSDEMAATGIGREVGHRVRRVRFDAEPEPAGMIELRYAYASELARLGVLPAPCPVEDDPLARREGARGFRDTGFAPDPFR